MNRNGNGHYVGLEQLAILPQVEWVDGNYASLQMRLELFEDMIVAQRIEDGQPSASFIVDPLDLAEALSGLAAASGLLPSGCFFWQRRGGQERLGVFVPPQVWRLRVVPTDEINRVIPLPGLVFAGRGRDYKVYAVRETEQAEITPRTPLFHAPMPNVSGQGVCLGSAEVPQAAAKSMAAAVSGIMESEFNNHLDNRKSKKYPGGILRMWRVLHRAKAETYPLNDLVEAGLTVGTLMEG